MKRFILCPFLRIELKAARYSAETPFRRSCIGLPGLKWGNTSLWHDDFGTGIWISARSARSLSDGEYPDAAQLHAGAPCHRRDHLFKDGVDDLLSVAHAKMWVHNGNALDQFRLQHCRPLY